ncbi:protein O-GlcNAcase isoform X1 [Polyodon spathula]|uniref:protein O-GlcNAcase isoform X1 n=1 Tax=Polyodon spathula TaxID=7913 RepID=UPI001B7E83B7|nr:protein O-GlcNAcase isoform X1 [Polyodon spathula]
MGDRPGFLCGVVEGFYGRPWSMEQRKVLFQWMEKWGLNTYLYGPKDDLKHRLLWREMYSAEEAAQLKTLVQAAGSRGLRFVYALSPGQDIIFSSSCDVGLMKRKLRQVAGFGCQAFAILFDDIDHSLCQADKEAFSSFAHAEVSVANEIFHYLEKPDIFLFCPTEYCDALCYPSLSKSTYLRTVGEELHPDIGVVWTGTKVISRELSVESLAGVEEVLRRRPLIWDNLHANDYDSKRVFLGPFKGRPARLVPCLRGLLLNPNCEFEANFIALHTLASWYRSGSSCTDTAEDQQQEKEEACERDKGKQTETQAHKGSRQSLYCPEEALTRAIQDWMEEIAKPLQPGRQSCQVEKQSPVNNTEPKRVTEGAEPDKTTRGGSHKLTHGALKNSPPSSLSSPSSPAQQGETGPGGGTEPEEEEWGKAEQQSLLNGGETSNEKERQSDGEGERLWKEKGCRGEVVQACEPLTPAQVRLLVGLYYLPHEHGAEGQRLLKDFQWLNSKSDCVSVNVKKTEPRKVEEWRSRALQFQLACDSISQLHSCFVSSSNRAVLYDLYPYLWDLRNTLLVAKAFVMWLDGRVLCDHYSFSSWRNCFHWCRSNASVDLLGESEPWVFKGGIAGEFQMMLPMGTNIELFNPPPPIFPSTKLYSIRPFLPRDKVELYRICRRLHCKTRDSPDASQCHPDLVGDRLLGAALSLSPEYCFVLEEEEELCGCALGVLDIKTFHKKCEATWLPAMREKYPKATATTAPGRTLAQEAVLFFHSERPSYPDSLLHHFPSMVQLDVLPPDLLLDTSVTRSLATCLLSALKANGSKGVFCEVLPTDRTRLEFFTKLGFLEIFGSDALTREDIVLGRLL